MTGILWEYDWGNQLPNSPWSRFDRATRVYASGPLSRPITAPGNRSADSRADPERAAETPQVRPREPRHVAVWLSAWGSLLI
jgi:hypothetical protein